jgi:translation initiation factor RLI1
MSQEVVILYIVFYYCWCTYHCYYFCYVERTQALEYRINGERYTQVLHIQFCLIIAVYKWKIPNGKIELMNIIWEDSSIKKYL